MKTLLMILFGFALTSAFAQHALYNKPPVKSVFVTQEACQSALSKKEAKTKKCRRAAPNVWHKDEK
jgi:hypothetical protein